MRESTPRQVDKESRGPQGEGNLEFSGRKKGKRCVFLFLFLFSPLHSLGLHNNSVLLQDSLWEKKKNRKKLLGNPIILKCKLREWV